MARTRTFKPEFFSDPKLAQLSRDARLTYLGLWTNSDDYGVCKGHPAWLRNQIFPYDDITTEDFIEWLDELAGINRILPFEANGEDFYFIPKFLVHQKINRPSKQRNPQPPKDLVKHSQSTHGGLSEDSLTKQKQKQKQKQKREEQEAPPLKKKPLGENFGIQARLAPMTRGDVVKAIRLFLQTGDIGFTPDIKDSGMMAGRSYNVLNLDLEKDMGSTPPKLNDADWIYPIILGQQLGQGQKITSKGDFYAQLQRLATELKANRGLMIDWAHEARTLLDKQKESDGAQPDS